MKRIGTLTLALLQTLVLAGPATARAGEPACRGALTGKVAAVFDCLVRLKDVDASTSAIEILPTAAIEGVAAVSPGAFLLSRPVKPGTFTLETLGVGRASVAAEGGTLYAASKTSSTKGEVTLTLTSVSRAKDGSTIVHGSYRARLLPAGGGKTGEVLVVVEF